MSDDVRENEYADIEYLQFTAGKKFRIVQAILGILSWPLVLPL